jgi:hypothetical protein
MLWMLNFKFLGWGGDQHALDIAGLNMVNMFMKIGEWIYSWGTIIILV